MKVFRPILSFVLLFFIACSGGARFPQSGQVSSQTTDTATSNDSPTGSLGSSIDEGDSSDGSESLNQSDQSSASQEQDNATQQNDQESQGNVTSDLNADGYVVQGNKIFYQGEEIHLFGINWFGFETTNYTVHGLWSRSYKDFIQQIKSLGFNAVRVPFCPSTLQAVMPTSINYYVNPDLQGLNSLEVLDKVLLELNHQQIYILMDHHRPDCNAISELWTVPGYTTQDWIDDLVFVANRYKNLDYFMGIDLKNEPHGTVTWGTGNASTDWKIASERAARAILSENDNILIFVEGIQESSSCSSVNSNHWWGGNLEPYRCYPLNIDATKLVLSPHVYGPDVWPQPYFSEVSFPENLDQVWETHFGFLANELPVVPGEFGGKYGEADLKDRVWQDHFVDYLIAKEMCSFFYWSLNPNSGDTGGILSDDWVSVKQDKMNNLRRLIDSCEAF